MSAPLLAKLFTGAHHSTTSRVSSSSLNAFCWRYAPSDKQLVLSDGEHPEEVEEDEEVRASRLAMPLLQWLADQHHLLRALDELRGHDLVCFCAPRACHGDLLARLANLTREERIAWWRAVKAAA